MPKLQFTYRFDVAKIHRAMFLRGLDQKGLAAKIGKSEALITKFFNGNNVSPQTAHAIIRVCGLKPIDVLLDELEPKTALKKTGTEARR